ncbi:MAG TPA: Rpn family recombination-promoting nuclease/putative transposase [Candidatus Lachnoclostridium pullistercoris]|uniref:Rpn family recombination-promoting nuclease/putative transposase n=1 Tax=Candidatus Lachnoclostridium pullistercoris TaxID=2838632 RepID=A0A9D2PBZ1_9FIRM|nr:Rpn family recombination-promoting nuclease/putative transposase [Candidatus Lachnoclostridium pullistercoris]
MAEKRIRLRAYDAEVREALKAPEIFADLFNGSVFEGRQVISPETLRPAEEEEYGPSGKNSREILYGIRDISREGLWGSTRLRVLLNVEGQRLSDYAMPVRLMKYDALRYDREVRILRKRHSRKEPLAASAEFLSGLRKGEKLPAVITLVFYYGEEPEWDGPRSLHEMLDFPAGMEWVRKLVPDYRIHLVSSKSVDKDKFRTGLREVFQLLGVMRDAGALSELMEKEKEHYSRLEPSRADLIGIFLDVPALRRQADAAEKRKERVDMCTAIQELVRQGEEKGKKRGQQIGERQGELRTRQKIVQNMLAEAFTDAQIRKLCGLTSEELEEIKENLRREAVIS